SAGTRSRLRAAGDGGQGARSPPPDNKRPTLGGYMVGAWQQTAGWVPSQQLRPAAAPYTGAVTTAAAGPVLFARAWCPSGVLSQVQLRRACLRDPWQDDDVSMKPAS